MARRRGLSKYRVAEMKPAAPTGATPQAAAERSVIFGTPDDRKRILIMMGVGLVLFALGYYLLAKDTGAVSIAALIFTAINGALLGMLLGQLMLVYPDRVMVVFVLMAVLLGETLYVVASGKLEKGFTFTADVLRDMTAIFFWAGFLGFWFGYIMFARRQIKRRRFQQRIQRVADEVPIDVAENDNAPSQG